MREVKVHAGTFLAGEDASNFIFEASGKLSRRRAELADGRARNAETDARVARLRADLAAEKERRAKENREKLREFDQQRADFRAELDRGMAEAKVEASLAFDRRVARKEVARHAWLSEYWTKIAKARDDKEFRDEWLAKVSAENPERAADLRKVFRSAGDSASALRGAEQFDLIRQRWERVVELLDADPTLTSDEAEDIADPEYREQRAEVKELDEARLAEHNAAQQREFDEHQQRARDAIAARAAKKAAQAGNEEPPIQDFVAGPSMNRTPEPPMTDSQMENMLTAAAGRSQDRRILDAMRTWTGPVNKKGRPKPQELSDALGFGVTRQRRNALWLRLEEK